MKKLNKIYIEITNICNLNCSFCSKNSRKKENMTLEEFKQILEKIKHRTESIYLHVTGEPLLHPNFEEILSIIDKYNIRLNITTNGTLLKNKIEVLNKCKNLRKINISLHSENHDENYYNQVFNSVSKLEDKTVIYRLWTLQNNKLDKYELNSLKSKIDNYDSCKKEYESTIKLLESEVSGKKVIDVKEKENQLNELIELYSKNDNLYASLNATLEKLKSSTSNIKNYLKDNKQVQDEYNVIKLLSDTANGTLTGKQRITFENYVQSYFMQSVLVEANKRLIKMTDSRYELKRKEIETKLNVKTGLDFSIFDSYTGKERDVASLSGGEKFKASLALALGLSDTISNTHGGIRIDSLFIDEGFGSLDTESLNQALNILTELSSNDKLIGVISHVTELISRIDNKIIVNKTSTGSKLIIES